MVEVTLLWSSHRLEVRLVNSPEHKALHWLAVYLSFSFSRSVSVASEPWWTTGAQQMPSKQVL